MAINKRKRTVLDEILPPPSKDERIENKELDQPTNSSSSLGTGRRNAKLIEQNRELNSNPVGRKKGNSKTERVNVMLYLTLPVAEQMRNLHFEEQRGSFKRSRLHDYYLEAIDLLFKNRGLKSIEELNNE